MEMEGVRYKSGGSASAASSEKKSLRPFAPAIEVPLLQTCQPIDIDCPAWTVAGRLVIEH
jgi:hypothetical protein